ncbi:Mpo1-like protein [Tundrisphaera lichenicola]|uniref:Mpo1-like protein n=1 Tax=Tundrisphaera lichenicola TaxID=2029860 RepID=UPI003EB91B5C
MLYPPQSPSPLVNDWIERHRDPRSFVLHLFGIPGTILGVLLMPIYLLLLSIPVFAFALVLFLGGFGLQFLGHALDGTEPGEIRGLRMWWARRREARAQARPPRMSMAYPEAERGRA